MFSLIDFLFPPKCLGCQKEGCFVCEKCFAKIKLKEVQQCPICKFKINRGEVCEKCKNETFLNGLFVASSYDQNMLLRKMVTRLKYKYNQDLGKNLGNLIFESRILSSIEGIGETLLVPVPLHFLRRWKRGFNQAEVLVDEILKRMEFKKLNLLKRIKNTPQQAKLDRDERLENLKGAFKIDEKKLRFLSSASLADYTIILVDDVASTLSTLEECAKVLSRSGFKDVWGVVVARG